MTVLTQAEGSVFLFYDNAWQFVCVATDDISIPRGDLTTVYTLGTQFGEWKPARIVRGAPGNITTTLRLRLRSTREKLLMLQCGPMLARVNFSTSGRRDDPRNYRTAIILHGGQVGDLTITSPTSLEPTTNVVEATVAFAFTGHIMMDPLATREVTDQVLIAAAAEPEQCGSMCETEVHCMEHLVGIANGTTPRFLRSLDRGLTWTSTTLAFTPTAVYVFGRTYLVGGKVTGDSAVIAYSVDGTTFTTVELGTTNDAEVRGITSAVDGSLYAVTSDGGIYRSVNGGGSWAMVYSAASPFNGVAAGDPWVVAVGNSGQLAYGTGAVFAGVTVSTEDLVGVGANWRGFTIATPTSALLWAPGRPVESVTVGTGISSLAMSDDGVLGIATSSSAAYATEDGGYSWYPVANVGGKVAYAGCQAWLVANTGGLYVIEPTIKVC